MSTVYLVRPGGHIDAQACLWSQRVSRYVVGDSHALDEIAAAEHYGERTGGLVLATKDEQAAKVCARLVKERNDARGRMRASRAVLASTIEEFEAHGSDEAAKVIRVAREALEVLDGGAL